MSYIEKWKKVFYCELCGRFIPEKEYTEKHHLIPVSKGGKHKQKGLFCIDCATQVHKLFTNKELKETFNTIEALKSDPRVQKWIKFIKNKETFGVCMKTKKKRR